MSSKRKRSQQDLKDGGDRHAKVRVQEISSGPKGAKQDRQVRPLEASVTSNPQASSALQESAAWKAARKEAKQQRRALKKSEKPEARNLNNATIQGDETGTKPASGEPNEQDHDTSNALVNGKSSKKKIGKDLGPGNAGTRGKRASLAPRLKWMSSDPAGGRMLDLDPLYTSDEKHLLVAYGTFVAVYSTTTSLLVRRLPIEQPGVITGISLNPVNDDMIYVCTSSQLMSKWDWKEGQMLNTWHLSTKSHLVSTASQTFSPDAGDVVYTIDEGHSNQWSLSVHKLPDNGEKTEAITRTLFKFENRLMGLQVLHGGALLVTAAGHKLIIGSSQSWTSEEASQMVYVWRIVDCPEWISSFNVRSRASDRTSKKQLRKGGLLEAVDVAIGGLKGTVRIYEDLFQKLLRKDTSTKHAGLENVTSRNLHWHRNAVMTVKWSLDGNYVISGGQETVLVIWQLETGRKQHLPHLGATIEGLVISPTGSSYSLRLADNSAMILSTSELRPIFSVAGIQVPTAIKGHKALPHVPSVEAPHGHTRPSKVHRYPACVVSPSIDRLLVAVPPSSASASSSPVSLNASYLQTCDISSGHQLLRQALTRTKVTTLNMGPESNAIEEPDVTHMQISHDGQWLATIDEWSPPKQDFAPMAFDEDAIKLEQTTRQETFLKFWSWNNSAQTWELTSRIDNPHAADSKVLSESSRVLCLASNPDTSSFSTIGKDRAVKTWLPVARMRREIKVRGKDGKSLTTWRCSHTTPTAMSGSSIAETEGAHLAYAADGSLLAAAPLPSSSPSPIYLIDTSTGVIQAVHNSMSSGPTHMIGIISKYLITLSNHLVSWDLVNNELHYTIDLNLPTLPSTSIGISLLAINHQQQTFAISIPEKTRGGNIIGTKVAIMDSSAPQPLFTTSVPSATITNLLPAIHKKGFYAIDTNAEIRTFTLQQPSAPPGMSPTGALLASEMEKHTKGINNIFEPTRNSDISSDTSQGPLVFSKGTPTISSTAIIHDHQPGREEGREWDNEHDTVVVSTEKLAEVFNTASGPSGSALGLPPVMELFERVAWLYDGKRGGE